MDPTDVIISKDNEIPIMQDLDKTIDTLCNLFPEEARNIINFFKYIFKLDREANPHEYQREWGNKYFKDLIASYFNDKNLISIMSMLLLNTGVPASEASALAGISTNPNPLDLPLNLSFIILTDVTCPKPLKACFKSSSVTMYDKLPT